MYIQSHDVLPLLLGNRERPLWLPGLGTFSPCTVTPQPCGTLGFAISREMGLDEGTQVTLASISTLAWPVFHSEVEASTRIFHLW